ncbi:PREDICTED: uncharacterized protein LOC109583544 [Amphimedon queenslandica]|uniref:Uncharacterized protein n=1 Tax=Amphimedon queenslandica TaxID=400682 RepID=A0A1X7UGR1_AMPQE|nr:PREDICTED: uncharacterized protein LOC109583544 [Amphimedon queenslandica]|eukprot:XP_019854508.1 PREDICTED: uncharacterized protein LOC109583544 [Amphimedon queenslandica]
MASNSELVEGGQSILPELAAKSWERSGIHYSTCIELIIKELSSLIIRDVMCKIRTNQIPSETGIKILHSISEQSISLLTKTAAQPLIIDLLHTTLLLTQAHNSPMNSLLSLNFLEQLTTLIVKDIHRETSSFSFDFKILLWQLHFPAYEATLIEILNIAIKEKDIEDKLDPIISEIRKACFQFQHFKLYTDDFFQFSISIAKNHQLMVKKLQQRLK